MNIPELSKGARHFGSPNRDNYRSDECQEMPRLEFKAEICNEEVKINFEKPTVI